MKTIFVFIASILLQSCVCTSKPAQPTKLTRTETQKLINITKGLSNEQKERYSARHPVETLSFFGIKSGSTVVEVLPGEGWYTKILLPYLGSSGQLIGVDYSMAMWPEFGGFATNEFIEKRKGWPQKFENDGKTWAGENGASVKAFAFGDLPQELSGKVDAVLFIRALHNLNRFEQKGGYLTKALAETYRVLKPNGVVGIVQHAMTEDKPNAWATGDRGYLKKSHIMQTMTQAGFEFVAESDINKNPNDNPQDNDDVWRLPPSLNVPEEQKETYNAIGESNRVTLLFKKSCLEKSCLEKNN